MRCFLLTLFLTFTSRILIAGPAIPIEHPDISSTFGEFRVGHFHGGLDFRTPKGSGTPVYAPSDGSVARVKISPWGYGKALYLYGQGDTVFVMGHLSGYYDTLAHRVWAEQKKKQSYVVEIWFSRGELPVKRGQVVAYSGATGVGKPHLHFEIRHTMDTQCNPFVAYPQLIDTKAPDILGLIIVPLSEDAVVANSAGMVHIKPHKSNNSYVVSDTIDVQGSVGFAVKVADYYREGNPNRMGPYSLSVQIDGDREPCFLARYDSVAVKDTKQIGLCYELPADIWGWSRYHRLYRANGVSVSIIHTKSRGTIIPSENGTTVKISVSDFSGNTSILSLVLRRKKRIPARDALGASPPIESGIEQDDNFLYLWAKPAVSAPLRRGRREIDTGTPFLPAPDSVVWRLWLPSLDKGEYRWATPFSIYRINRKRGADAEGGSGRWRLAFPKRALFPDKLTLTAIETESTVRLLPEHHIFARQCTLFISLPENIPESLTDKSCVVRIWRGERFFAGAIHKKDAVGAALRALGEFGIAVDTLPPTLNVRLGDTISSRRQKFSFGVKDDLAGFDNDHLPEVWLDDTLYLITEYDSESDKGRAKLTGLPKGKHKITVRATDVLGNSSVWKKKIVVK